MNPKVIIKPYQAQLIKKYRLLWENRQTNQPLISFPVATYNRESILLNRTLPSIFGQSYQNFEVVIVGDCIKNKKYIEILLQEFDSRLKIYDLKRRTIYPDNPFDMWCVAGYRPRNIAARLSRGDWHWWISDDDELLPHAIESLVEFISQNSDAESVYGNYQFRHSDGIVEEYNLQNNKSSLQFDITGMPSWITRCYLSRVFRWNGYSYLNQWNKPSDYDLQARLFEVGVKFKYLNKPLALIHPVIPGTEVHGSKAYINYPETYR